MARVRTTFTLDGDICHAYKKKICDGNISRRIEEYMKSQLEGDGQPDQQQPAAVDVNEPKRKHWLLMAG